MKRKPSKKPLNTKEILNAYSDICLTLSPLDQEQRVRVVKAVAIILKQFDETIHLQECPLSGRR